MPSDASRIVRGMSSARSTSDPSPGASAAALVDHAGEVGVCSTRPALTSETGEAGVDTLRLLFETTSFGDRAFELDEAAGWHFGAIPALGLTWAEGHPAPGQLAGSAAVDAAATVVRDLVDERFGVRADRGVARLDSTATQVFGREAEARAFMAGMAALQLPRCETTRRGHPVHSVSWTHAQGARKLARCYDKGLELGGEPWRHARMEDQRRYPSAARPMMEAVAEPGYARGRFEARFGPIRKAVDGVKAATFPVIAQAIADEVRYGYRDWREAERLAGALVLLSAAGADAYPASRRKGRRGPGPTFYRRRAELREAGYVVVDDLAEVVEVNLGEVVEAAIESEAWER